MMKLIQSKRLCYLPRTGKLIDTSSVSASQLASFTRDNESIIFDSAFEFECYRILRTIDSAIKCHYPVLIKEQTKNYPAIKWRVDFYLPTHDVFFESKGYVTKDFILRLKMLDARDSETYSKVNFIVPSAKTSINTNRPILTLQTLQRLAREGTLLKVIKG